MRLGIRKVTLPGLFATAGTLALLLSACGGSSSVGPTQPTGPAKGANQKITLYWASGGGTQDIATLDPAQAQDSGSIPIVNTIFDQLVTLDANLKPELWGADKLTTSADGLTYTFHIRANQKFSDGTPVKASDYAFAVNRSANPCEASPVAGYLAPIKDASTFIGESCGTDGKTVVGSIQTLIGDSIVADDSASTLTFTLAAPAGYFEEALTYSTASAVEQSALGDGLGADGKWLSNLAQDKGNSGMFNVKNWDHAGNLDLVPNPNWWGIAAGKKPNFTEVDYKIFADSDTMYNTYQSDPTAAFVDTIPTAQVAAAKSDSDYQQTSILLFNGFSMNYKIKPFDNKDARLAFCEAINRDSIATNISKGLATPTFHIVPQGMPGYNPNLTGPDGIPTAGDLAKAQAHWNAYKATLNGAPVPAIKLSYNLGSAAQKTTAEYYQSTFNSAFGLNVQIDQTAWPTILSEENSKTVQLFRFAWLADYPDPQDFLTLLFDTTAPYNNWNASVPAADTLMEAADKMFLPSDQDARMQKYNQAEQLLINDGAFCPTTTSLYFYKLRPWVYGMKATAQESFVNDMWANAYLTNQEPSA
jgi:oligopeptide transport system substrate-binding protein